MRPEDFLRRVGEVYRGRIPAVCSLPQGIERDWEWLESRLCEVVEEAGAAEAFLRRARGVLETLKEDGLRYRDLVELFQSLSVCEGGGTPCNLQGPLGRFLLALHDTYVLGRNRDILPLKEELQEESTCRRCGLCCIGPAEGPISTSPADLSRWDAMGRDDLLYFTRFGPAGALRARSLEFPCCPFLRFSAKKKNGHCLVHPVKPLVCRQFVCG